MRTSWVMAGVVVLIAGFAIAGYGLATPVTQTSTTTVTNTLPLVPQTGRTVSTNGFWAMGAANLVTGEAVSGTVSISNFSASDGPVFVYVQNESSFIAWGACAPCGAKNELNHTLPSSGTYSFTWNAPSSGSYYFVLDNEYYGAAAPSTFSATGVTSGPTTTSQNVANTTLDYGGIGVAVLGAVILGAGLVTGAAAQKKPTT